MSSQANCILGGHPFVAPNKDESRSPCPALNALANHGFIDQSGRDITFFALVQALREVYNISLPLALLLSIGGFLLCRPKSKFFSTTIDLHDLARHNKIEHDASLSRDDAVPPNMEYAPTTVNLTLIHRFLQNNQAFSLRDLAKARMERERDVHAQLNAIHTQVAAGEASMTWQVMHDEHGLVAADKLRQWYGEDRLPDNFTRPVVQVGLKSTHDNSDRVKEWMKTMKETLTAI